MKRVGKFHIEKDWIDNSQSELVEMFHQLQIVVIRAEFIYHRRSMEYIAYSPNFRELSPGEDAPVYQVIASNTKANSDGLGETSYTVKEQPWTT